MGTGGAVKTIGTGDGHKRATGTGDGHKRATDASRRQQAHVRVPIFLSYFFFLPL